MIRLKKIKIKGGFCLKGNVKIAGAKNAVLAILPATVLIGKVCRIENVPDISDISLMCCVLAQIGVQVRVVGKNSLEVDARHVSNICADFDEIRHMRASYYLLGAMLGRFGEAAVAMPGGCDFGLRPTDQHIKGFEALGAKCDVTGGITKIKCDKLVGNGVYLDVISVGATINTILTAVKAEGTTIIENAAKEPHVVDLSNFLNSCGADIRGAGTDIIKVCGVKKLRGTNYQVIPDQIEAGTYMAAALATNGNITVEGIIPKHLESITAKLEEIGADIEISDDSIRLMSTGKLNKCNVKTMPYPGFPTDMQPQIVALLSRASGTSMVSECVWDHRFRHVSELRRMGAEISVDGRLAVIEGVGELSGTNVKASDLRAGAALIIAGLSANGSTIVENTAYIERGYENIAGKLFLLGADIKSIDEEILEKVSSVL